ncbi:MAG: DUF2182 domain-containing protein [Acidobacteriota bacterium]
MPTPPSLRAVVVTDRAVTAAAVSLLALLAWFLLASTAAGAPPWHDALTGGHAPDGFVAAVLAGLAMWVLMMVAMMLPAALPWIVMIARLSRSRQRSHAPVVRAGLFTGGYLAIWIAFSLAAAVLQAGLHRLALLDPTRLQTGRLLGAGVLIGAGLFQLSPLKDACLAHCRSPLTYFLARWRDGPAGAFGMGWRHGGWCLGCCWALMIVSFALGVMNLLWMAGLTLFLIIEKNAPGGVLVGQLAGCGLVVWGVGWLV